MSTASELSRPRLALFDLDHTLLPMDSDHGWGEFTIAIGWCDRAEFGRRNDEFFAHYQAGTLNVADYVRPKPSCNEARKQPMLHTSASCRT